MGKNEDRRFGSELIFLVSQPRAGSTLLQRILGGHPHVATTSEPWIALHQVYALRRLGISTEYDARMAYHGLVDFLAAADISIVSYRQRVASLLMGLYAKCLKSQRARLFLDKTPRYYYIIRDLASMFPGARFILLLRNPVAVLSSIIKSWLKGDWRRLCQYTDDLLLAPHKLIEARAVLGSRCLEVKYEDLTLRPEATIKGACSFLGIEYIEAMLCYASQPAPKWRYGDDVGIQQHQRPAPCRVDAWRTELVSDQDRHVAVSYLHALGPDTVSAMGYDYADTESSLLPPRPGATVIPWEMLVRAPTSLLERTRLDLDADPELKGWLGALCTRMHGSTHEGKEAVQIMLAEEARMLRSVRKELACVTEERDALRVSCEADIQAVRDSISWKITAPLRWAKAQVLGSCERPALQRAAEAGRWLANISGSTVSMIARGVRRGRAERAEVPSAPAGMTLYHLVDYFETGDADVRRRLQTARKSWSRLYGVEDGLVPMWQFAVPTGRTARSELGDSRSCRFVRDLFDEGAARAGEGSIVYTNADICLIPEAPDLIRAVLRRWPCGYSLRTDFARIHSANKTLRDLRLGSPYVGADLFAFRPDWWREVRESFPDLLIGYEGWDFVMKMLMDRSGFDTGSLPSIIYHEAHPAYWTQHIQDAPGQIHNRSLAREWALANGYSAEMHKHPPYLFG